MLKDQNQESADKRKTIMIFGISSFIGSNLAEFFRRDYRVVGTYHKRNTAPPGILTLPCDVFEKEQVQLALYALKPDIVLYCVGLTSLKDCNDRPNLCDALNSSGLMTVAEIAPRYGARVIYFSSHFVFSGMNKSYIEMDNPDVTTNYGKAQAQAEFYLQKSSLNYLIFRCGRFYGRGINPISNTFFELLQRNLRNNQAANYDNYVHQGFLDVYYLGIIVKMCIDKNISNRLIHFTSQDQMTYHEFAKAYCEIFNQSDGLINTGKWFFPIAKGTNIEKLEEHLYYKLDLLNVESLLKIKIPSIKESLEFTYRRFQGVKGVKVISNKGEGVSFV